MLIPSWFFGYDVALEFLFAVIAFIVAIFARRLYNVTNQRQIRLFSISFLFIAISYLIKSVFNYLIISKANENIHSAFKLQSIAWFDSMGVYAYMLFMTIGLVILAYMTFKTDKPRILWLMLSTSLLTIIFSVNKMYIFFLLSSIYLIFLLLHFASNYWRNKQKKTLLVAVAFLFLLFGSVHFFLSVNHQLFYAIGHILEFFAYLLILLNFYLVLKNE